MNVGKPTGIDALEGEDGVMHSEIETLSGTPGIESESAVATTLDEMDNESTSVEPASTMLRRLYAAGRIIEYEFDEAPPENVLTVESSILSSDFDPLQLDRHATEVIVIKFSRSSDGRGFSLAAHLRQVLNFDGTLVACGINPDQVSSAFQIGFDCIQIDASQWQRYGEAAWKGCQYPAVNLSYLPGNHVALTSIWGQRAEVSEGSQ